MASRAVCPRCRRSYDGAVAVCAVDGALLLPVPDPPRPSSPSSSPSLGAPPRSPTRTPTSVPPPARPPREATNTRFPLFAPGPPHDADETPPSRRAVPGPPPPAPGPPGADMGPGQGTPVARDAAPPPEARAPAGPPSERDLVPPPAGLTDSGRQRFDSSANVWAGERLGPYRLVRQLGEGGMARIYLAEHEKLGRICAIKRLHADHFADRLTVARFLAEARAVGAIHHPNLVAAYDVVEEPNEIYLVMEYLDGRDVAQVLRAEGPMAPARAVEIIAQACDGLAAVHQHNIIHRDLKPENIFLTRDSDGTERVKLLDFGVARLIGDRPQELKTRSGLTVGTPTYMSPEQATASEIDARSDVYTIGVVLYEMLAGAPPFTGAGYGDVMLMHVNDPPPRLSSRRLDVPAWIEQIVMRCLEKEPAARFQSAGELAATLRASGRRPTPVAAPPAPASGSRSSVPVVTAQAPARRIAWPYLAGGAGALAVVAGVVLAMTTQRVRSSPEVTVVAAPELPVVAAPVPPVSPVRPAPPSVTPTAVSAPAPLAPAARPAARVRVMTDPRHARVALEGDTPCRAPCDLHIPPTDGRVAIRVDAPGYLAETRLVDGIAPPAWVKVRLHRAPRAKSPKRTIRHR